MSDTTGAFKATYAERYDRYLAPLLFAPYAWLVSELAQTHGPRSILETAAGTGCLTRELVQTFPAGVQITATDLNQPMIDLNQPMIDRAKTRPCLERVSWQQADATSLRFPDESFDLVVCQFGLMFFPDNRASFANPFSNSSRRALLSSVIMVISKVRVAVRNPTLPGSTAVTAAVDK